MNGVMYDEFKCQWIRKKMAYCLCLRIVDFIGSIALSRQCQYSIHFTDHISKSKRKPIWRKPKTESVKNDFKLKTENHKTVNSWLFRNNELMLKSQKQTFLTLKLSQWIDWATAKKIY